MRVTEEALSAQGGYRWWGGSWRVQERNRTWIVILIEAKDLLSWQCARQQVLRFAQDDKILW